MSWDELLYSLLISVRVVYYQPVVSQLFHHAIFFSSLVRKIVLQRFAHIIPLATILRHIITVNGFGGLGVACWPLVPKFAGSYPAEAAGFLRAKKILSTPSFGGEVKPSVACRRFAACKRSLNGVEVVISAKLPDNILAHSFTFGR